MGIRISRRFHTVKGGVGGKGGKQTSSTEGSGIAIDFAGWKMNNFFFFLSLSLVPPVCTRMYVDIMDKMGEKKGM